MQIGLIYFQLCSLIDITINRTLSIYLLMKYFRLSFCLTLHQIMYYYII